MKHVIGNYLLVVGYSFLEYFLGRSKRIVANSTWELVFYGFKKIKGRIRIWVFKK